MNVQGIDAFDVKAICQCINEYGEGGMEANKDTIPYFHATYAKECITKALGNNHIRSDVKVMLRKIKDRITD